MLRVYRILGDRISGCKGPDSGISLVAIRSRGDWPIIPNGRPINYGDLEEISLGDRISGCKKDPDSGISLFAIMTQLEGAGNSQRSVRDLRKILGK